MKIKVGNQTFDSKDVPIAVVIEGKKEQMMFYRTTQTALVKGEEICILAKAPPDIPLEVAAAWIVEACPEKKIPIITTF